MPVSMPERYKSEPFTSRCDYIETAQFRFRRCQAIARDRMARGHALRNRANYSLILDIQGLKLYP